MVIVLFIIMLIGLLLGKMKVVSGEAKNCLSFIIINVSMPMMIVSSCDFEFTDETKAAALWVVIIAAAIFIFSILLATILFKKEALRCATVFSNAGYMGLPVLDSILGPTGLFLGAIFQMVFHLFLWTYGISLYTKSNRFSDSLKKIINPSLIAVVIGVVIMFTDFDIPDAISTVLELMGGLTTPLSMLLIGSTLAEVNFKEIFRIKEIYIVTAIRLIIIPASVLLFLLFPNIPRIAIYIVFIINAMPSAAVSGILALKYKKDEKLASSIVAFSTLVSIVTVFLITEVFDFASILALI
ncbi:MAG: AEC family transporter [Clostridia bacterium]